MKYKILFWTSFIVISILFFVPLSTAETTDLGLDKIYHFLVFGGLLFLAARSYGKILVPGILLAVDTILVEFIQGQFFAYRNFDLWDAAAGILGIIFVLAICWRGNAIGTSRF